MRLGSYLHANPRNTFLTRPNSATLGVFAVTYVSDASVSINALVLLAAAGAAQQSQGYQLEYYMENDAEFSWRKINIVLSFGVAAALQVAEFYVVGRIVNESPGVDPTDWLVFVSYIVGYGMFGGKLSSQWHWDHRLPCCQASSWQS